MSSTDNQNSCFTSFRSDVSNIELPEQFTFPFFYTPHRLTVIASEELQQYIAEQEVWNHNFGLESGEEKKGSGKMFGVLVVKNQEGEIGYLSAFSGNLAGKNNLPGFVPSIYDSLDETGFFKIGEKKLNAINHEVKVLLDSEVYKALFSDLEKKKQEEQCAIQEGKAHLKEQKKKRKQQRKQAQEELTEQELSVRLEELSRESQLEKIRFKHQQLAIQAEVKEAQDAFNAFQSTIDALKQKRKTMSASLQQQIFDEYQFLNAKQDTKSLCSIFDETNGGIVPPAGAGDCAAPKLLQYAYEHNFTPFAMGEFWWGVSPKTEVRHHNHFYPSCRGKCEPILGHMLQGLNVEANPMLVKPDEDALLIEVVYEDDDMLVINKPSGLLSVPGKNDLPSAFEQVKAMRPDAEGPLLVHRLDMATSGLLLVAKNLEVHHTLQDQFMTRTIKKRYVAVLDGEVAQESGLIDLPLRHNIDDRPRQLVCFEHGKQAQTRWEKVEVKEGRTRVNFYPITGRSHQLRVHAAFVDGLNTPIVGDNLYGVTADRLYLHAEQVDFTHPTTKEKMTIVAKAPF